MQIPFIGRFYDNGSAPLKSGEAGPTDDKPGAPQRHRPRIGIALGAGAARGWSHIGVLKELCALGLKPDIVAGASIGAVVGGCFAAGRLDALEQFACDLSPRRVFSLMDITFSGAGLLGGGRLKGLLEKELGDSQIEDMPIVFGAVATACASGQEVWLTHGRMCDGVRASYALPGIFEPVHINGRWLFDGALVNPVPVTLCRALGADIVIAVNLISDSLGRSGLVDDQLLRPGVVEARIAAAGSKLADRPKRGMFRSQFSSRENGAPSITTAMLDAFNITQDRIARSRLAGDPPDVSINSRVQNIGLFDFHRARELIEIGTESVKRAQDEIEFQIGTLGVELDRESETLGPTG
ncbi:MAG: patatin-like phospholipase family protein [Hyphomicrobiales bacterium]|nr:patatin-like phospholipase family protein [Hyphomicrobiales bacterium]MDE2115659.1 patatin-like phospholipase family protein [Hyphomicrobiales bacterium]